MSRRTIYITMLAVGIVLEVLLLRLGAHSETTPAVAGRWTMRIDGPVACAALRPGAPLSIAIAQSGPDIRIALPDGLALIGSIERGELHAISARDSRCAPVLSARVARGHPQSLEGVIDQTRFTAIRLKAEERHE